MTDRFIVAYPNTLVEDATLQDARKRADGIRESRIVKVYRLIEVETWMPLGGAAPPKRVA